MRTGLPLKLIALDAIALASAKRLAADNDIPLNVDRVLAKPLKLREALARLRRPGQTNGGSGANPELTK